MGLKKAFKKIGKVVSAPIKTNVDKIAHPGRSIDRIKNSFKSGNFLDPVAAISQELDPGVAVGHEAYRQISGQPLDPASNVNKKFSNVLGTQGHGWLGNKPATVLGAIATSGGFAAGAGGGAAAAGAGGSGGSAVGAGGLPLVNVGTTASALPASLGGAAAGTGGATVGASSIPWGDIISGGVSIFGGIQGSKGAKSAAKAQEAAAEAAIAEQRRQYDQSRSDLAPYREAGGRALTGLENLTGPNADYSGFLNSPDYLASQQQGVRAVDQSAAGRGGLFSGNAIRAQTQFGQANATQYLGNYRNALSSIAGVGQNAVNTGVNAGQNYANSYGQQQNNIGDARASGIVGQTNAWGNALIGAGETLSDYLARRRTGGVGG